MQDQMYRPPGYLAADPNAVAGPSEYTLQQYAQPYAAQPVAQQYAPPQMFADPGAINDSTVNAALAVLNRAPISRPMPAMRGSGAIGQADQTPYGEYLRTWGNIAPEVFTANQVSQVPTYSGGDSGSFGGGGGVGNVTDEKSKYSDFLNTPFGGLVALGVNAISPGEARTGLAPVVDMSNPYSFNPPAVPSGSAPVVSSFDFMGGTAEEAARGMDAGSSTPGNVNFTGPMAPAAPSISRSIAPLSSSGGGDYSGDVSYGGSTGSNVGTDNPNSYSSSSSSGSSGGGKIVCTAMNQSYGFGSFRNAIWLKYAAKNLTPAHEKGYHVIFLPLVDIAYRKQTIISNPLRAVLENIARHRSADLRAEMRNQRRDPIGRAYRFILEPLCFIVGKLKGY